MSMQKALTALALAGALHSWGASAQDTSSTTTNQELFRVAFSANCLAFDSARGRIVSTRITERNIIAQALGVSASNQVRRRDFALVFNATQDSLQVVNANGEPVVDVVHFGGGAAMGDPRQTQRCTFMFFPGQTNEFGVETNAFGTALITEHANKSASSTTGSHANITGRLQFTLTSGIPLGTTNAFAATGTTNSATSPGRGFFMNNLTFDSTAQICVGVFTTGERFPFPIPGTGATNSISTIVIVNVTTPAPGIITNNTLVTTNVGLANTTGMLPTLTGNGSLPGLGVAIGPPTTPLATP